MSAPEEDKQNAETQATEEQQEEQTPRGPLGRILALPNDNGKKMLFMAIAVCFACSVIVASAAVGLRPLQLANEEEDRIRNIVEVSGMAQPGVAPREIFEEIESKLIRLSDGTESDRFDPTTYDIQNASRDDEISRRLSRGEDKAGINRLPEYMPVFIIRDDAGELERLILPVHGYGLWSTMYGFLALDGDLKTTRDIKFYQHAETPGLGGEIDNPNWRAVWEGKIVYDDNWEPTIRVVKGSVNPQASGAEHQIDGLAGATLTARGVENLVNFWLGEQGYKPFINRLREERG